MGVELCKWCGVPGRVVVDHHVLYEGQISCLGSPYDVYFSLNGHVGEFIHRICRKCHFNWHKRGIVPCKKCVSLGTNVIRYHRLGNCFCVYCDPCLDRLKMKKIYDMLWDSM